MTSEQKAASRPQAGAASDASGHGFVLRDGGIWFPMENCQRWDMHDQHGWFVLDGHTKVWRWCRGLSRTFESEACCCRRGLGRVDYCQECYIRGGDIHNAPPHMACALLKQAGRSSASPVNAEKG